jgi:hypothetical protein
MWKEGVEWMKEELEEFEGGQTFYAVQAEAKHRPRTDQYEPGTVEVDEGWDLRSRGGRALLYLARQKPGTEALARREPGKVECG